MNENHNITRGPVYMEKSTKHRPMYMYMTCLPQLSIGRHVVAETQSCG